MFVSYDQNVVFFCGSNNGINDAILYSTKNMYVYINALRAANVPDANLTLNYTQCVRLSKSRWLSQHWHVLLCPWNYLVSQLYKSDQASKVAVSLYEMDVLSWKCLAGLPAHWGVVYVFFLCVIHDFQARVVFQWLVIVRRYSLMSDAHAHAHTKQEHQPQSIVVRIYVCAR